MISGTELFEHLMRQAFLLAGARSHWVRRGGETTHVLDLPGRGPLPPVVLVHGFSASGPSQFAAVAHLLRPHVSRILLPDLPGHGMSSVPRGGLSAEGMVDALVAAVDEHLEEPALMFATSMGGGLAVHYALRRPANLRGLMLCSPSGAPFAPDELDPFYRTFRIKSHGDALAFVDRLFVDPLPPTNPLRHVVAWGVRQQFNRPHLVDLLDRLPTLRFLSPDEIGSLRMPVNLIWGGADDLLPASHFEYYRRHLPSHAEIDTPPHFGHAPFLHHPEDLAEKLLRFARGLGEAPIDSSDPTWAPASPPPR